MSRFRITAVLAMLLVAATAQSIRADVRSEEKTRFQLAGMLGRMVNLLGGKAAREGVTSSVAVKGSRKLIRSESTGQIIDLAEEKVYDLDLKKKTYKVTTFAELRHQMEEAQKRAADEARKAQASDKSKPAQAEPATNAKQMDVDVDVKNTGEKKDINGFATSQAIVTITVREKGKTLQESGGMVLTSEMWLTASIPAMKEVVEFDRQYAQKLYGPTIVGASPQEMAQAVAMYPMMKPAVERMATEAPKLQGTPILTTTTIDAVKSAEQMTAEQNASSDSKASPSDTSSPGSVIGGLLARRLAHKNNDDNAPKDRSTVLTTATEVLKVTSSVAADEVAVPPGFKEVK
jgi:hypothetical protein